jgi:hypothetical protein
VSLKQFALYIFLFLLPIFVQAGGDSAGGGYAIQCGSEYYSLDYKASELLRIPVDPEIESIANSVDYAALSKSNYLLKTKSILELIASRLEVKLPNLGKSLRAFARLNEDPSDKSTHRLWQAKRSLVRIPNELTSNISDKSCFNESGLRNSYQAAIRYSGFEATYEFDPKIREELSYNPIQLSFFFIHEWLRDYIDDPNVIAVVDRFLHSSNLNKLSANKISKYFISKGFEDILIGQTYDFIERYKSGKLSNEESSACDRTDMIALSEITEQIVMLDSRKSALIGVGQSTIWGDTLSELEKLQLKTYRLLIKRNLIFSPCSEPNGLIN